MKKKSTFLVLILASVLLLVACGSNANNAASATPTSSVDTVIAEGHLVPSRNQYLAFQARGKIDQILVKKGDQVKQGQVLVSLSDRQ